MTAQTLRRLAEQWELRAAQTSSGPGSGPVEAAAARARAAALAECATELRNVLASDRAST